MKKLLCCFCGLLVATASVRAGYVETFSYPDGPLLGNDSWTVTGTVFTNPEQVSGGKVALTTSGQDMNAALASPITIADGTSLFFGATINLSAAQATGDYFLHVAPGPVGNSSAFFHRLFAKSSGAGYVLGYVETSGGAVVAYGSTVLNFGTDYRVVVEADKIAGPINDTAEVYVNPTDLVNPAGNTAYLTKAWTSTTAETNSVLSINIRQGSAANSATLVIDDLALSQTFSEVSTVPEPQTLALVGGFGLLAWNLIRRRK